MRARRCRSDVDAAGHAFSTTDFRIAPIQIAQMSLIMRTPKRTREHPPKPRSRKYHYIATIWLPAAAVRECRKAAPRGGHVRNYSANVSHAGPAQGPRVLGGPKADLLTTFRPERFA